MTIPTFTGAVSDDVTISDGFTHSITPPDDQFVFLVYAPENFTPTFTGLSHADLHIETYTRPGYILYVGYRIGALASLEITWSSPDPPVGAEILALGFDDAFNYFHINGAVWRYTDTLRFPSALVDRTGNLVTHAVWPPLNGIVTLNHIDPPTNPTAEFTDHIGWLYNLRDSSESALALGVTDASDASFTYSGAVTEPYFAVALTMVLSETGGLPVQDPYIGFQYTHRWNQIAEVFNAGRVDEALLLLELRDRELEEYVRLRTSCPPFEYTHRWHELWLLEDRVAVFEQHDRELEEWFATGCGRFEYTHRYQQIPGFVDGVFDDVTVRLLDHRDREVEERMSSCTCGGPV